MPRVTRTAVVIADPRPGVRPVDVRAAELRQVAASASLAPSDGWALVVLVPDAPGAIALAHALAGDGQVAVGVGFGDLDLDARGVPWGDEVFRARRLAFVGEPGVRATDAVVAAGPLPVGVGAHRLPHPDEHRFGCAAWQLTAY